ncbi:MAG TPA: terminase small subunit [Thermotogota bacterium]|nr:terminase small subunit [Thermotogota bacterium]
MDDNFSGLTDKQRAFCLHYCTHWNATKAAKQAGYSEKTAQEISSENLSKPIIQAYIKHIQSDIARAAGVSALRNLMELTKIAYTNPTDIRESWDKLKDWESIPDDVKAGIAEVVTVSRVVKTSLDDDKTIELETVKVKMHDKLKALDMINRMLGYNEQQDDDTGSFTISFKKKNSE